MSNRPWIAVAILLPLLACLAPRPACALPSSPLFRSSYVLLRQQMPVGSPHPFALADVNGDGAIDLVALGGSDFVPMTIRFGDGYGNFGPAVLPAGSETLSPHVGSVYVADLNRDGRADLVFGYVPEAYSDSLRTRVAVMLGHGDGTFDAPIGSAATVECYGLGIGDMNEDGIPDLVCGNYGFVVLLGDGTGRFAQSYASDSFPDSRFALADVNHDGHLDVLSSGGGDVYLGDGRGAIAGRSYFRTIGGWGAVAALDLDHDGAMDVVTGGDASDQVLFVHFGTPAGSFDSPRDYAYGVPSGARSIAVADLDHDGQPELISAGSDVEIESIRPDGTLEPRWALPSVPDAALYAEVADLDRDGWPDIVVGGGDAIAIYFGGPAGPPPAAPSLTLSAPTGPAVVGRFSDDGRPEVAVLLPSADSVMVVSATPDGTPLVVSRFAVAHGSTAPAVADIDGDGRDDLLLVNGAANAISIFRSLPGNGWARTDVAAVGGMRWVVAGDLDHDGHVDLVTEDGTDAASGAIETLMGSPSGFGPPQPACPYDWYRPAACLADIDGDGQLDLVLADSDYGIHPDVMVLPGLPGGTFDYGRLSTGYGGVDLAALDFDHDGKLDVFAAGTGSYGVGFNQGGLVLSNPLDRLSDTVYSSERPLHGAAADVDGDGWADFAIDIEYAAGQGRIVSVFRNDGAGNLAEAPWGYGFSGGELDRCLLADLTGDGQADLIVTEPAAHRVWVAPHVPAASTGVAGLASGGAHVVFAGSAPNPTRGAATIRFAQLAPGQVRLAIVDVRGRIVRRFADRAAAAGAWSVAWDGRDDAGARVGPGIYFARLTQLAPGQVRAATGKLVVLP